MPLLGELPCEERDFSFFLVLIHRAAEYKCFSETQ